MPGSFKILSKTADERYMFMTKAYIILDIAICAINKYIYFVLQKIKLYLHLGVGIRQIIVINIITHESLRVL